MLVSCAFVGSAGSCCTQGDCYFYHCILQIARRQFLSWKCGWLIVHLYVKSSQLLVSCWDEIDAGILICFSWIWQLLQSSLDNHLPKLQLFEVLITLDNGPCMLLQDTSWQCFVLGNPSILHNSCKAAIACPAVDKGSRNMGWSLHHNSVTYAWCLVLQKKFLNQEDCSFKI